MKSSPEKKREFTSRRDNVANVSASLKNSAIAVKEPATLLPFLLENWPNAKRKQIKTWLKFKAIAVNGQPASRFDHPLRPGDQVAVVPHKYSVPETLLPSGLLLRHEDEDVIVVEKPAGMLTIATETERENTAYFKLNAYLNLRDPFAEERVFIVHRLDRETSGLLVLAKSEKMQETLQRRWEEAEKIYLAVVEGTPQPASGTVENYLVEAASAHYRVFRAAKAGEGKLAITHYKTLKSSRRYSLLEVRLQTGRKNQIRVHLADLGHPVAGDEKYGAQSNPVRRMGLHAHQLAFPHPRTGEMLRFTSPLPAVLGKLAVQESGVRKS